jgi:drug/metabolite transporter (DMT)-like permease
MDGKVVGALVASACVAAVGQLLLKIGATKLSGSGAWLNVQLVAGLAFYAVGVVLWLFGLSRAPLHTVYPFAILTFVLVGALAVVVLGERPSLLSLLGWCLICGGIALAYAGSFRQ